MTLQQILEKVKKGQLSVEHAEDLLKKEGYEEGDLIDIPSDQFVSVRVEMPQDSIWNLAQRAAQEEMELVKTSEE